MKIVKVRQQKQEEVKLHDEERYYLPPTWTNLNQELYPVQLHAQSSIAQAEVRWSLLKKLYSSAILFCTLRLMGCIH